MSKSKDCIKIIFVIIGTIIGAGFASGKEVYIFFGKYGIYGILGSIISSILTAIILYSTLIIVKRYNIQDNDQFVKQITKGKTGNIIIKNIINIFLLISFWIMYAGFCTFFKQELGIPIIITDAILAIVIYVLFMKNIDGIIKVNTIMVPIMIIIIIVISLRNYSTINISREININSANVFTAILSAITYTSYNSITLIPIIISLSKCVKDEKDSKVITVVSSIIIFILLICIYFILTTTKMDINNIEIPILAILNNYSKTEKILYSIAIISAIFTSAISAGYGILENVKNKRKYKMIALIICTLAIPISYIGFGRLVEILYPVFGVIGIGQIVLILFAKRVSKGVKRVSMGTGLFDRKDKR